MSKLFANLSSKRFLILSVVLLVIACFSLASCDMGGSSTGVQQQQQQQNLSTAQRLCASVGGCNPNLTYSNELFNQKYFYQVMNNPSLVGYVYLLTAGGTPEFEYQVRGKCSSTESQLTTPATIDNSNSAGYDGNAQPVVIPAPQPDGSYGQNENGIFCVLNDAGHTIIEFNAASWYWIWSQQRITLPTPAIISIIPNGK